MKVRVRLFAALREAAGCETVELELAGPATVGQVREGLARAVPAAADLVRRAMFAVDAQYAADGKEIGPGADVACIPPVSGGENERPMIQLTTDPIDTRAVLDAVRSPAAGAVVLFLGTVREMTDGRRTESLDYECFGEMANSQLAQLECEARQQWDLVECAVVHRTGHLPLGETSVAIAVSAAHRAAAFEAASWLIDRIKQVVPIWKKENYADGTHDWVHPGE